MASFFSGMGAAIRRAVGTEKAEPISLETSAGPLRFSAEEAKLYSLVFAAVDSDDDGEIGGGEGATFLRRTGLSEAQLKTVSAIQAALPRPPPDASPARTAPPWAAMAAPRPECVLCARRAAARRCQAQRAAGPGGCCALRFRNVALGRTALRDVAPAPAPAPLTSLAGVAPGLRRKLQARAHQRGVPHRVQAGCAVPGEQVGARSASRLRWAAACAHALTPAPPLCTCRRRESTSARWRSSSRTRTC